MAVKLLLVEDEDIIRNEMETYIRFRTNRFSRIYTAENGKKAIDIIFQHRPEVMLLDIEIPLKNGWEVIREAKESGVFPRTIILSSHDEFSYIQRAIRYGVRDYIRKPCCFDNITRRLLDMADEFEMDF